MRIILWASAWALGILIAQALPFERSHWQFASLVSLALLWLTWRSTWRWFFILSFLLMLGAWRSALAPNTSPLTAYAQRGVSLTGQVASLPDRRDTLTQFQLEVESLFDGRETYAVQGKVLVQVERSLNLSYGESVQVGGVLVLPAELERFSYADFLARQGIFVILPNASLERLSPAPSSLAQNLYELRTDAQRRINQALPEPLAGLLVGILLGNERGISPELQEAFSRAGASHIVAISGFNMIVLAGLLHSTLGRLIQRPAWVTLGSISLMVIYTLFVGATPSIWRATLMSSLLIIAGTLQRRTYTPSSLAFALVVLTLENPLNLWDLGFQLSMGAALGLSLFNEPLLHWIERTLGQRQSARWSWLFAPLSVALCAQIFTAPLIALNFGIFSLVSLLVNLLIVPVQPAILLMGGAGVLLSPLSGALSQLLLWGCGVLLAWTIGIVRGFASLPFAQIVWMPSAHLVASASLILIGGSLMSAFRPQFFGQLSLWVRQRSILLSVSACAGLLLVLLVSVWLSRPDGRLHVWFLDVGHSNAILIQTPRGAQILIDGGRAPARLLSALGERLPFYDNQLELLVITHPDEQDTAALPELAQRYRIGAVWTNGQADQSPTHTALIQALGQTPVLGVQAGYRAELADGVSLEVISPIQTPAIGALGNQSALVLRLSYGAVSFLLTSDIDAQQQIALLDAEQVPSANVIQVPRHGAQGALSQAFIAQTQANLAILQADKANRLGDPHPDTLAQLGTMPLLRTDTSGTLHLWTDGTTLWYLPKI